MVSYQEALLSVLDSKINLLTQLKGKLSKLDQELATLNSMKEDTELKLGGLERPGRRRKGQVDKWLKDVEQIKEKRQDIMNQINEICIYESIDEVIEGVIKDVEKHQSEGPSSDIENSSAIVGDGEYQIRGIGGIGKTYVNLTNSHTTLHLETFQINLNYDRTQGNGANGEGKA